MAKTAKREQKTYPVSVGSVHRRLDALESKLDLLLSKQALTEELDRHVKAEEKAKPIPFGTPVKLHDETYLVLGPDITTSPNHYWLWKKGGHFGQMTSRRRSEFTITNP